MKLTYDLHIHSCLSPCGSDEAAPGDIAGFCKLAGLDVAALADHNSCRNCPAFLEAAADYGLLAIPAMELTTAEEAHILCLLPGLEAAAQLEDFVSPRLPPGNNIPEVFGHQLVCDAEGRILSRERRLLTGAADIGVYRVAELISSLGGVAIPAHIDRSSYSVLSNLGFLTPEMHFPLVELSTSADIPALLRRNPELAGLPYLVNSDAHALFDIPNGRFTLEAEERSVPAVLDALRRAAGLPRLGETAC